MCNKGSPNYGAAWNLFLRLSALRQADPKGVFTLRQADPKGASAPRQADPKGAFTLRQADPKGAFTLRQADPKGVFTLRQADPKGAFTLRAARGRVLGRRGGETGGVSVTESDSLPDQSSAPHVIQHGPLRVIRLRTNCGAS